MTDEGGRAGRDDEDTQDLTGLILTGAGRQPAGPAGPMVGPDAAKGRWSRYLLHTERPVIHVHRHWAILLRYAFETLAALLVAGFLAAWLPEGSVLMTVVVLGLLFVIGRLGFQLLEWRAEWFVVTDRRMLLITGLLTRKVAMMPLRKVTDMTYQKSLPGRVLNYGEFIMESAGQDQALHRVRYVPNPDQRYREVSQILFGYDIGQPAQAGSGGASSDDGD